MDSERPAYVTTRGAALALSVHPKTMWTWVRRGYLRAIRTPRHYSDERPRKRPGGRLLIELDSLIEMLERMYAGEPVPLAIRQRLRALAAKSPQP